MPSRARYSKSPLSGVKSSTTARQAEAKRERDRFYNRARWRRLRASFLSDNPLCVDCLEEGIVTPALVPHHEAERLARPDLAYDAANLTPLCGRHHTLRHKAAGPARPTPGGGVENREGGSPSRAVGIPRK